jgi:hypothetical protein
MPRKPKYPTPEEAVSHFTASVTTPAIQTKWGTRAAEGASKLGKWFEMLFPDLYRTISELPLEPDDPWLKRSKPVGQLIKKKAKEYRTEKLKALATLLKA